MDLRCFSRSEMIGRQHDLKRAIDGTRGIGEKAGDAGNRFLIFGIKHRQDGANQQGVCSLFSMIAAFAQQIGRSMLHRGSLLRTRLCLDRTHVRTHEGVRGCRMPRMECRGCGTRPPVTDIGSHGVIEEQSLLAHDAQKVPERAAGELGERNPIQ